MFLRKFAVAAGVCCVLAASFLSAQDQTKSRSTQSRGTQGSAGQALPFVLANPSASSRMTLTNVTKVQEELGLTEEQKQQLNDLRTTNTDKQRELYAEVQKRAAELNQQAEEAAKKLLDEKQGVRLEQLRLQREGLSGLAWPEVAEKLGLNAEQRDKLTNLAQQWRRV